MEIKICGLRTPEEAEFLNEAGVDYAGFVFYEKSKRNIDLKTAREIMAVLDGKIRRVAVSVSPDAETVERLCGGGFDILQIHGELKREALEVATLPVWYAVNIADEREAEEKWKAIERLPQALRKRIGALVMDAPQFGSGRTFSWKKSRRLLKAGTQSPPDMRLVLAGGLSSENVAEGIRLFEPDVVDVSSSVENGAGKDRELILAFTKAVRNV